MTAPGLVTQLLCLTSLTVCLVRTHPVIYRTNSSHSVSDGLEMQDVFLDVLHNSLAGMGHKEGGNEIEEMLENNPAVLLRSEDTIVIITENTGANETTTTTIPITTTTTTGTTTSGTTDTGTTASTTTTTTTTTATTTTTTVTTTTTSTRITTTTTTTTTTAQTSTTATAAVSTTSTTTNTTTTTTTSTTTTTTAEPKIAHPIPGWALGIICLIVAVIVFSVSWIFFIRYRRRKIPLAKPVNSIFRKNTTKQSTGSSIIVSMFEEVYREKSLKGQIAKEFEQIQEHSARLHATKTRNIGQSEINQNRNRFVDIIPFDDNFVRLKSDQGLPPSTYINASYVDNMDVLDKVIVTQGPKQNTVLDFWRMVVEKKCRHIIMLTNCLEQGRVKCFQYWPPNGQMLHFDDISLCTVEEKEVHMGLFMRKIEVSLEDQKEGEEVHVVRQLHLTNWPDHGVPDHVNSLLAFLRVAANFRDREYSVVHCSAGVGRTGTYLALLALTQQVQSGCDSVDIMETVRKLREKRPKMVQTQEQYVFLYQCLVVFIRQWINGEDSVDTFFGDRVLDAGVDNFGFEHVKL